MSDYGDLIDEARTAYGEAAPDFFPDICTVRRATSTQGTSGGMRPTYSDLHTDLPCKYTAKPKSGMSAERMMGGAVTAFIDGELALPYVKDRENVVIQPKDRIVVAGRSGRPDRTFEIVSPGDDSTGMAQTCLVVMRG